ncbi:MAG: DMT family transporter [Alphaproteobacteria bacterium]
MQNVLLYAAAVLIWGSTWFVIKFQLGTIDPFLSVSYRFFIAAIMLFLFCAARGHLKKTKLTLADHRSIGLQGFFVFCLNYYLSYLGVSMLTTGLVAVCFSTITLMNALNQRIFLKIPLDSTFMIASALGLLGIGFVFWPEIGNFYLGDKILQGVLISLAATYIASIGNIMSFRNNRLGMPVVITNMYGMFYGACFSLLFALAGDAELTFDTSIPYITSILYLSLFGSVIAFGCYFTLMQRIGADRAAYSAVLFPVVALIISTLFENYSWTPQAFIGVALILGGNVIAMRRRPLLKQNAAEDAGCQHG